MKPLFAGLVVVAGRGDSGKTSFAIGAGPSADLIAFIDADIKGKNIKVQMEENGTPFGMYVDLVHQTAGMREIQYHEHCLKLIDEIPAGRFELVVWDTWTSFETTFFPYVEANQSKFRAKWSAKGDIHGAQIWQTSFDYETMIIDRLLTKAPMLILTTTLKDETINGKRTGKQIPDMKKPLVQKSQMRLMLLHNPVNSEPDALVLKRISKNVQTEYGIETIAVLPRKIGQCTWSRIREYWANPIGMRPRVDGKTPLEPDEIPNAEDIANLNGSYTAEMLMIMQLKAVEEPGEEEEYSSGSSFGKSQDMENDPEAISKVKTMIGEGKPIKDISTEIGLPVSTVLRMSKK